jgi:tetratricopeptide (TPR) repeat protein
MLCGLMTLSRISLLVVVACLLATARPLAATSSQIDSSGPVRAREVRALIRSGQLDEAIRRGEALSREFAACSPCHHELGLAYAAKAQKSSLFTQLSWGRKCKGAFAKAVELDGSYLDARFDLFLFYVIAPGIGGGSLEKAGAEAEAIQKLDPSAGRAAAAMILEKEKDFAGAEREFRAGISLEPVEPRALRYFLFFLVRQQKVDEAFAVARSVIGRYPGRPQFLYLFGRLAASTGKNPDEGLTALDSFLQTGASTGDATPADAYFRKGQILAKQGKKSEARAAFETALTLIPGHPGALEEMQKL